MTYQEALDHLKENCCRMTGQRKIILSQLVAHQHAMTTVDILLQGAKKENPAINATTLYRNLDLLFDMGLLYTDIDEDGTKRYKLVCHMAHHHHITCTDCGQMTPIDYCPIAPGLESMVADKGYTLEGHRMELFGVCDACRVDDAH